MRRSWAVAVAIVGGLAAVGSGAYLLRARAGGPPEAALAWKDARELGPGVRAREAVIERATPWRLVDLEIDLARAEVRVAANKGGGQLGEMIPPGTVAAVNGGYFDERYRPTGWLVDRGAALAPRVARASGGVLAARGASIYIGPLAGVPWEPELAVQNGPRLVEGPGRLGIRSDDGKRAARTIACDVGGRLHLVTKRRACARRRRRAGSAAGRRSTWTVGRLPGSGCRRVPGSSRRHREPRSRTGWL
jgi:hypothetical protein